MVAVEHDDSWKPDGWESWTATRRTLWRREQQAERMEQLNTDAARTSDRDLLVRHLRAEVAELRQRLESEEGPDLGA